MFKRLRQKLHTIHSSLLPQELAGDKRKTRLFYASFYLILASTFLTIFGQLPMFSARSLTQLFQVGWVIVFIPLIMLDYKRILRTLCIMLMIIAPFILYCLVALIFKVNSFSYGGTTCVLLCSYLFILFSTFSKYKTRQSTRLILGAFLAAAIIYASVVFLTKLMGYDLNNQIYAFNDKNSAGPIFMSAAIIGFYLFNKRNALNIIIRWSIMAFFIVIIALSKTRSVLITIPIIIFIYIFSDVKNNVISSIILLGVLSLVIIIFAVPVLRDTIIVKILFNGKTDLDSITSGRLSQIIEAFAHFKPFFGNGGYYIDCMPVSFLASFGIIGFVSMIPFLIFPFFILFSFRKHCWNPKLKELILCMIILFTCSALLEGYGYIGPGAKVFVFWFLIGNYSTDVVPYISKNPIFDRINTLGNKTQLISKKVVNYTIQLALFVLPVLCVCVSAIPLTIGEIVVDRLPSSNVIAPYKCVEDITFTPPLTTLCVGQKITFTADATPIDAEDTSVYWSVASWISSDAISVDGYTGLVTANHTGESLVHLDRFRVGPNGIYKAVNVTSIENYSFSKLHISTKEFHKSFEHTTNESIELIKDSTSKIYHDNFYLPDVSRLRYESSNPSIAVVENNLIKALSPGECDIKAYATGKDTQESLNYIHVKVTNDAFVPVSSMETNVKTTYYQYEENDILATFNSDATDKNYSISIEGIEYEKIGRKVKFLAPGNATVSVTSDNNPNEYHATFNVNVIENKPSHFECHTKRIKIGETKNAYELQLYLAFENGYKKIVDESDLEFKPRDFTNHAWTDRNGLVKGKTVIKAVKPGTIKLSFVSKINPEIKKTFSIISSVYTEEQYVNLSMGIGSIAIDFILIASLIFSLFIKIKHDWILYTVESAVSLLYLLLLGFLYGFNGYFIASTILILLVLATILLLRLLMKNRFPLKFLDEPINIVSIQSECRDQAQEKKIEI